ncbi:MAG: M14 family metallopeptidase [Duganella sp.]
MKKFSALLIGLLLALGASAQQFQGQPPIRAAVDTSSRPTDRQAKGVFPFAADGVFFSNEFDGARLNAIERTGPNAYTISITPENAPINMSPWYAFQVWSAVPAEISVKLVYPEPARHRYTPQVSSDGLQWTPLEAARITEEGKAPVAGGAMARPQSVTLRLATGKQPLWIAGQELHTSKRVFGWIDDTARQHGLTVSDIGKSTGGRPLKLLTLGNPAGKKALLVISRQHPPEVTGYFAMQSFVETLAGDSELAQRFRKDWTVYVVPLMNPDGVDGGFWRHNVGGIDLNRDWADFNQPETRAVRDFLKQRSEAGVKFYFGIDFHSTWDDIYYTLDKKFVGNMPGLVPAWLEQIQRAIPDYRPVIQASDRLEPTTVSRNYFLKAHGMEAIVFEIGDNTPRDLIRQKGQIGATELMKLILAKPAP